MRHSLHCMKTDLPSITFQLLERMLRCIICQPKLPCHRITNRNFQAQQGNTESEKRTKGTWKTYNMALSGIITFKRSEVNNVLHDFPETPSTMMAKSLFEFSQKTKIIFNSFKIPRKNSLPTQISSQAFIIKHGYIRSLWNLKRYLTKVLKRYLASFVFQFTAN